jgi:hypothetical protein
MINQKQFNEIQAYFNKQNGGTIFLGYVFHLKQAVYLEFMNHNGGYIVGYSGGDIVEKLTLENINKFIMKNYERISNGTNYLGLWLNPENNMVYIDASIHFDSIYNALDMAKFNNQSHIFDCKAQKSMNVITLQYE